jgi:hypothetical protein
MMNATTQRLSQFLYFRVSPGAPNKVIAGSTEKPIGPIIRADRVSAKVIERAR